MLCCCSCAVALADTDRQQADPPHQRKGVRWRDAARGGQGKGEAEGNGGIRKGAKINFINNYNKSTNK